ncbi:MAG: CBS domain-containing protein [Candidatus Rokubacteria bacterium]|nr:CBS domain-containing protein [Candidatus Rokubacteria bacterium]
MKTVREVMVSPVVTATPRDTLADLFTLSQRRQVRHFPVVENERLVGIVTDRNLREAATHPAVYNLLLDLLASLDRATVEQIMVREVITVTANTSLRDAAKLMRERRVGCLPVVEDGRLIGIVTASDLLGVLAAHDG